MKCLHLGYLGGGSLLYSSCNFSIGLKLFQNCKLKINRVVKRLRFKVGGTLFSFLVKTLL